MRDRHLPSGKVIMTLYWPPSQSVWIGQSLTARANENPRCGRSKPLTPALPGIPTSQSIMLSVPSAFFTGLA